MKAMLKSASNIKTGMHDGISGDVSGIYGDVSNISGNVSGIYGDVSNISGNVGGIRGNVSAIYDNVSGIYGDVSNISGNLDECELTDEDRARGIDISQLIG